MNYQLINPDITHPPLERILLNRGIEESKLNRYINIDKTELSEPEALGEEKLFEGLKAIFRAIKDNAPAVLIVDCDCDGYTSSAVLLNYLHDFAPTWVENIEVKYHKSKSHGLSEFIDEIVERRFPLVICPDSSSNDYIEHCRIKEYGGTCLVLDHHLADRISEDAIVVNNQLSDYPNKELSGAGVVWQFCRYADKVFQIFGAEKLLDLVALGLDGDMMSASSLETRYLINEGFKKCNIHNPFIDGMLLRNEFPLSKPDYVPYEDDLACTPMGAAFFIVPFVNAITRSGTQEEKELLFLSMLNYKAYKKVPSTKRGHKPGEEEMLINQALRVVGNVKNRQTKAEDSGLELLRRRVEEGNMLAHNILVFLLEKNEVAPEIRGLVANKLMSEYQRPVCVLTKNTYTDPETKEEISSYEGSARGYTKNGVESLKDILDVCPGILYSAGHHNACGLGLREDSLDEFLATADAILDEYPHEIVYRVDYIWDELSLNGQDILDIAHMNSYWGQDVERALVLVKFKITNRNFAVMARQTLKFTLPNKVTIVKFAGTEEEIKNFTTDGYLEVEAICKCCANNWNGNSYPQLMMIDYQIVDSSKYFF